MPEDYRALRLVTESRSHSHLASSGYLFAAAAVSVDGHSLVLSGTGNGTVRCWDLKTGASIFALNVDTPVYALVLQADYRMVIGTRRGLIVLQLKRERLVPLLEH